MPDNNSSHARYEYGPHNTPPRVTDANELYTANLVHDSAPLEVAVAMLDFALKHDLALHGDHTEVEAGGEGARWNLFVTRYGVLRKAHETGLYLPGETSYNITRNEKGDITGCTATATAWTRLSREDTQWVSVNGHAKLGAYVRLKATEPVVPMEHWIKQPETRLMEIASIKAARIAVGDAISNFLTAMEMPNY